MVTAGIPPFRENSLGRARNRTRDLMISSQRLWPLDHKAGRYVIYCTILIAQRDGFYQITTLRCIIFHPLRLQSLNLYNWTVMMDSGLQKQGTRRHAVHCCYVTPCLQLPTFRRHQARSKRPSLFNTQQQTTHHKTWVFQAVPFHYSSLPTLSDALHCVYLPQSLSAFLIWQTSFSSSVYVTLPPTVSRLSLSLSLSLSLPRQGRRVHSDKSWTILNSNQAAKPRPLISHSVHC